MNTTTRSIKDSPFANKGISAVSFEIQTSEFDSFSHYCSDLGVPFLPADPTAFALYMEDMATKNCTVAALEHIKVTIHKAHALNGLPSPVEDPEAAKVVEECLSRARGHKREINETALYTVVGDMTSDPGDVRDKAIILVSVIGDLTAEEVSLIDTTDITVGDDDLTVRVRRFERPVREVRIPIGKHSDVSPVYALLEWLDVSGVTNGPLFRTLRGGVVQDGRMNRSAVNHCIQYHCERADVNPAELRGKPVRRPSGVKYNELKSEVAELQAKADAAARNEHAFTEAWVDAEAERDGLRAELARVRAELEQTKAELDRVSAERRAA